MKLQGAIDKLKNAILKIEAAIDQKQRIAKLPVYIYEKYVVSGRLTEFYNVGRQCFITITLDNITYDWDEFKYRDWLGEEITHLLANKTEEDAMWWEAVLSAVRKQLRSENSKRNEEAVALVGVFFYRCQ
jgi:hypothetical protein